MLGYGKDWLVQYQDNVRVESGHVTYWWTGLPVGQHYKVTMSVHYHKLVLFSYDLRYSQDKNTTNQLSNQLITQSHYPDTEPTSPCPILLMLSNWLGSDKNQF